MQNRILLLYSFFLLSAGLAFSQGYQYTKQGFSMRLALDNRGSFGRVSYPGVIGNSNYDPDSIGLEYPIGQPYEHIFGGGIWVGGILDTSTSSTQRLVRGVTTGYEGWSGPFWEFFPGTSAADSIFRVFKSGNSYPPKPSAWDEATGLEGALPWRPISDADYYMKYTDYGPASRRVSGHVPLNLKVFQSSYVWNSEYADAILILEYRIINNGRKSIDSAYIGFFFEGDVGPYRSLNYAQRNFTGYTRETRTAYIHNPVDVGSTPVGCSLLWAAGRYGASLDSSVRYAFRWWPGTSHPGTDDLRYQRLASGIIDSNQSISNLSDTRCLFGFGPFTISPSNPPLPGVRPDTLKVAVAIVSGYDPRGNHVRAMSNNATKALNIYLNQGIQLPAIPPSPPLRAEVGERRVHLNWLWTAADSVGPAGRANPVSNWDTTSIRAREHPEWAGVPGYSSRISLPAPPGLDSSKGGRNFESFRLWRSESPRDEPPDETFTLVKQWDVMGDSIEYETGFEYDYVDSNLVRGKRYHYSVTSRSIPNLVPIQVVINGVLTTILVETDALESTKRTNRITIDLPFAVSKEVGKVAVVPNPYRTDKDYTYESGGYEKSNYDWTETRRVIKFINLPTQCTIRVFSLAGDLIRTIQHDGGTGTFPRGDTDMPLVSESNRALASGIYIFTVESAVGTQVGKFVIIR
jgi:hypothetical protein